MTFDRLSYFDRSFFDRMIYTGPGLPARIAGKFTVATRTTAMATVTRPTAFTVVAFK